MKIFSSIFKTENSFRKEKFSIFVQNLPVATFGNIVNAGILSYFLSATLNSNLIFVWLFIMMIVSLLRLPVIYIYKKSRYANILSSYLTFSIIVSALLWGILPIFFFPENSIMHQVFLIFVLGGMAAGSLSTLSFSRSLLFFYISILLLPLLLRLAIQDSEIFHAMIAMMTMFYIILLSSGSTMYNNIVENLILTRKSREDEIKIIESESSLQNLFDATPMGIFIFDLTEEDRLVFSGFNLAAERILHQGCQKYIGKDLNIIFPALDGTEIPDTFRRVASENAQWDHREIHYHSDHINGIYEINVFQIRKYKIAIIFSDITERKKMEQQLIIAKDDAEAANSAKSSFLSNMSHELRTPLNAILGFAQILSMRKLNIDEMDKKAIFEIKNAGDHLLSLINELLDLAKIESGKIELYPIKLSIGSVLNECVALIENPMKNLNLRLEFDKNACSELYIHADYRRLKQLIINILSNAVKYNRKNGTIQVMCTQSGDKIQISITDTGAGISEYKLNQLFKPFHRLHQSEHIEGTGIGLMISRDLARLMKGDITVRSKEGEGSTFTISLPVFDQNA